MTTFLRCYLQEEGPVVLTSLSLIILIAVLLGLVLIAIGVKSAWKARGGRDSAFEVRVGDTMLGGKGKVAVLIVVLIGFILVIGPFSLSWYIYKHFSSEYEVAIDTPTIEKTLEDIRLGFHGDTQIEVKLSEDAKAFRVSGQFQGKCVSDLFHSICRRYNEQLECETGWMDGTSVTLSRSDD